MSDTTGELHTRDGVQVPGREECVEVFGVITERQWRVIELTLDMPRGRFKSYSTHRVFGPLTAAAADDLCTYLRDQNLPHDRETTIRWSPQPERSTPHDQPATP